LTGERDCGQSSGVPTAEMGRAGATRRTVGDWGLGDEGYWSSGDTECSKRLGDKGEGWMGVRGKDKALISMMGDEGKGGRDTGWTRGDVKAWGACGEATCSMT
jgi:hypothetical protein